MCVCVVQFVTLKFILHMYDVLFVSSIYLQAPDVAVEWAVVVLNIQ